MMALLLNGEKNMLTFIDSVDVNNTLGESVVWCKKLQCVCWTDIEEKKLYLYHVNQKKLDTHNTPYRLCAFGFTSKKDTLIAAFDFGIALYNYKTKAIHWLFKLPKNTSIRFNDGRIDVNGRFWVGTMNEKGQKEDEKGRLYLVDHDFSVRVVEKEIGITNGIAWNNEANVFYLADSAAQKIFQYNFDNQNGVISHRKLFSETENGEFPDGSIVDSQNYLWNAYWGGGCLVRYASNGVKKKYPMPVSQPTCMAFGGNHNKLLFVSSAKYGLSEEALNKQALAGSLLIFECEVPGVDSPIFSIKEPRHYV